MSQQPVSTLTLDGAKSLEHEPAGFLCKLNANKYALQFLQFKLKNPDNNKVFVDTEFEEHANEELLIEDEKYPPEVLKTFDEMRYVRYAFAQSFLKAKNLSCFLKFKVGDQAVKNLVLIENHYFKGKRIAMYEFKLPFCSPNSKNQVEYVYEVPQLEDSIVQEILTKKLSTHSDTFFFADGEIIMHNKAEYTFD